jgi:ribosomal protein S4
MDVQNKYYSLNSSSFSSQYNILSRAYLKQRKSYLVQKLVSRGMLFSKKKIRRYKRLALSALVTKRIIFQQFYYLFLSRLLRWFKYRLVHESNVNDQCKCFSLKLFRLFYFFSIREDKKKISKFLMGIPNTILRHYQKGILISRMKSLLKPLLTEYDYIYGRQGQIYKDQGSVYLEYGYPTGSWISNFFKKKRNRYKLSSLSLFSGYKGREFFNFRRRRRRKKFLRRKKHKYISKIVKMSKVNYLKSNVIPSFEIRAEAYLKYFYDYSIYDLHKIAYRFFKVFPYCSMGLIFHFLNKRLDFLVRRQFCNFRMSRIRDFLRKGLVYVNGIIIKDPSYIVRTGQLISFKLFIKDIYSSYIIGLFISMFSIKNSILRSTLKLKVYKILLRSLRYRAHMLKLLKIPFFKEKKKNDIGNLSEAELDLSIRRYLKKVRRQIRKKKMLLLRKKRLLARKKALMKKKNNSYEIKMNRGTKIMKSRSLDIKKKNEYRIKDNTFYSHKRDKNKVSPNKASRITNNQKRAYHSYSSKRKTNTSRNKFVRKPIKNYVEKRNYLPNVYSHRKHEKFRRRENNSKYIKPIRSANNDLWRRRKNDRHFLKINKKQKYHVKRRRYLINSKEIQGCSMSFSCKRRFTYMPRRVKKYAKKFFIRIEKNKDKYVYQIAARFFRRLRRYKVGWKKLDGVYNVFQWEKEFSNKYLYLKKNKRILLIRYLNIVKRNILYFFLVMCRKQKNFLNNITLSILSTNTLEECKCIKRDIVSVHRKYSGIVTKLRRVSRISKRPFYMYRRIKSFGAKLFIKSVRKRNNHLDSSFIKRNELYNVLIYASPTKFQKLLKISNYLLLLRYRVVLPYFYENSVYFNFECLRINPLRYIRKGCLISENRPGSSKMVLRNYWFRRNKYYLP